MNGGFSLALISTSYLLLNMNKTKVCVISTQVKQHPASQNVIRILEMLLTKEKIHVLSPRSLAAFVPKVIKPLAYFVDELILSLRLLRILPKVYAIFLLQEYHVLPSFLANLSGRKLVLFVGGSPIHASFYREQERRSIMSRLLYGSNVLIVRLCNKLSHRIVVVTPSIVSSANLERYKDKLSIAPVFPYISSEPSFDVLKEYDERKPIIGFVGRLEKIKGILNFVEAVPYVLRCIHNLEVLIIGDGPLRSVIERKIEDRGMSNVVKILGKVPHENLPYYYNELKLLVLPSYSEGIPLVILEAMLCGTPSLATPAGGIPDIISEGVTGFILRSNDPKNIAEKIIELLNKPELLKEVSRRSYNWVKHNLSVRKTLKSWHDVLQLL